jgi:hypothetical protein
MSKNPTAAEVFESTKSRVLERVVAAQRQQIADLKNQVLESFHRERAARRALYQAEAARLVKPEGVA